MARSSELDSLKTWFAYNAYARRRYLDVLATLPPEELSRDRGASYPTILDIFTHTLDGIALWTRKLSVLHGTLKPPEERPDNPTVPELRTLNEEMEKVVDDLLSHLTEEDLDKTYFLPKMPPWWDDDYNAPVRATLCHLIEHELQHRGELNALLWQIDVEPPIIDFLFDGLTGPDSKPPWA